MPYVNPIFACQNHFYDGGFWSNDPAGNPPQTGYPKESVADWLTYSKWEPALTTLAGFQFYQGVETRIDYFGMAGHNLGNATIVLQYHNGVAWVNCFTPDFAIESLFFKTFNKITVPAPGLLRVQVSAVAGTSPIYIGVLATGERHDVPFPVDVPFTPARFGRADKILTSRSVDGEYLGSTLLFRGAKFSVGLSLLPPDYITSTGSYLLTGIADTLDHLNSGLPCFFSWNQSNRDKDVSFCKLADGEMVNPRYPQPLQNRADFEMEGIVAASYKGVTLA